MPREIAHYDIVWDAIVVKRADGSVERHACGETDSDTKKREVFAQLKKNEAGWSDMPRAPALAREV